MQNLYKSMLFSQLNNVMLGSINFYSIFSVNDGPRMFYTCAIHFITLTRADHTHI